MALAPRRPFAALALASAAAALAGALLTGGPALAGPPTSELAPEPSAVTDEQTKAQAKAEVMAASAAFEVGDYALALTHFEAAMALRPAPKLHYNLAVCHQRLSLQTDDPTTRTGHREQAIDSYNRYLELNPQAEDRREVAAIIRELGGTPVTLTSIKPVFDTNANPNPNPNPPADEPELPPERPLEPAKPPPPPHHGRFGMLLGLGLGSSLITNQAIAARALFMIDLHGGGFVGRKRRFLLAAQTSIYTGASLQTDRLSFAALHLGLLGEQQWVVARERLAISVGGVVGLASQTLSSTGADLLTHPCRISENKIAGRNGGQFGARFQLAALVGERRRGMLTVLVQPTLDVFGPVKNGANCSPGQTPWTALNMSERWQFLVFAGAGYSLRF